MKNRETKDKIIWLGIVAIFVAIAIFFGCSEKSDAPIQPAAKGMAGGWSINEDGTFRLGDRDNIPASLLKEDDAVCVYDCYGDCPSGTDYDSVRFYIPVEDVDCGVDDWECKRSYCRFRHKHEINGSCNDHQHREGFKDHPAYNITVCFEG